MHKAQKLINHVSLVLDASYSMRPHERNLIKVADEQIKHLALRSEELSQETRVSIYLFGEKVECLIFDMDVMRLPSVDELYRVKRENTALIDAVVKSQDDLATTSQLYGDHAFLSFILTDGQENWSKRNSAADLRKCIVDSGENWTLGFLVPDQSGVTYMTRYGALADACAVWDTTSAAGLADAANKIKSATDNFMTQRTKGVRGTRSVFSTGVDAVNKQTVRSTLEPLSESTYRLVPVSAVSRIDDFVNSFGSYVKGKSYYQLTKTETIQPQKDIIVVEKGSDRAYSGRAARDLIGLPATHTRVRPDHNPRYEIFVQSTSYNRKLVPGTRVLVKA